MVSPPRLLSPRNSERKYRYEHFPTKFDPDLFETELILKAKLESLPSPHSYSETSEEHGRTSRLLQRECRIGLENVRLGPVRTKQEVRTSLSEAAKFNEESSLCWPRTLLFYAYSLWFLQLSAMLEASRNKLKMLRLSLRVLHHN